MPKVSVIIPCLNMVHYIQECINSVVCQSLSDIEILVVDAGSVDGTLEILKAYATKDLRIRIIASDKRSYGYQVNLGLEEASGEYIAIVDADDRISPNMYETLYENAVQSGADYVKGTARMFFRISEDMTYYRPLGQFPVDEYKNGKIEIRPMDRPDLLTRDNFLWYGIFRREFMQNIRLHESPGAAFQDLGGLLQTQICAKKAVYLKESFYEYRQDNVTASNYNPKGFQYIWEEYTWAEQFVQEASAEWKAAFYRKMFLHTLDRYGAMAASAEPWEGAAGYIVLIREKLKNGLASEVIREASFTVDEWKSLKLFLADPNEVHKIYHGQYIVKKRQLMDIRNAIGDKEVVIFGCGRYGQFVHAQLLRHNWGRVVAYCDNKGGRQRTELQDIPILTPLEAVKQYADACFVVASRETCDVMKRQLLDMNIDRSRICEYTAGIDMKLFGI